MAIALVTAANVGVPNGVAPLNAQSAVPVSMGGTGVTSFPAGALTSDGTTVSGGVLPVAYGGTGVTSATGTGNLVLGTTPVLVNPNLGTPSTAVLTNATGLPLTSGTVGTLPIDRGGTGSTSSQAALNVLAGSVVAGTFMRGNGTNVGMSVIQVSDVPTLNQDTTGTSASVTAPAQPAITSVGTLTSLTVSGACSLAGGVLLSGDAGTTGQVLTSRGPGMPPIWTTVSSGGSSPPPSRRGELAFSARI